MVGSSSFDSEKKKSSMYRYCPVKYRNEDRVNFAIV